jgi:transposase
MGINQFTEEQQAILRQNPYVIKVSKTSITYSKEFKERFYHEYKDGNLPSAILRGMSFDPRVLGKKRIDHLVGTVRKYEAQDEDFRDRTLPDKLLGQHLSIRSTIHHTDTDVAKLGI